MKRLWILHFAGNAVLLALLYHWLGIGDATSWQLITSLILALAIPFGAVWLHAGSFVWFREHQPTKLVPAFQTSLRRLPAFSSYALLALVIYWLLNWLESHAYSPMATLASWLTLKLRVPVSPMRMYQGLQAGIWGIRWLILPPYLLPLASAIAAHGWHGFRGIGQTVAPYYWLKCVVLTLAAFYVPDRLIHWVPKASGITLETVSFLFRFLIAYLACVTAWLALLFVSSGGRPRVTQPITVNLP